MTPFEQTWRWFGPSDPITLQQIRQTGATGIVSALHHLPNGVVWPADEIMRYKEHIEGAGLRWSVVESIPVHDDIKRRSGDYGVWIDNYRKSLINLGKCGIDTVCYNFMPVLDWTRTSLDFMQPDGSTALLFDETACAAFDLFILKRPGAESEYEDAGIEKARSYYEQLDARGRTELTDTILAGLPGAEEGYTPEEFLNILHTYKDISADDLRNNLRSFLREIIPAATEAGVRMAIHPDDPPFPIFGLPRVVSTEEDARFVIDSVDSVSNGLTFCTGSFGARPDNDLAGMAGRLGSRVNFVHLRNVKREEGKTFYEADHLGGDVDMPGVMQALVREQMRRIKEGRTDTGMPYRPDHGHKMLDDLNRKSNPGYSLIGRMRGLAELRGLETGIRRGITNGVN